MGLVKFILTVVGMSYLTIFFIFLEFLGFAKFISETKYLVLRNESTYNDQYISLGFTFMTKRDGTQKPQCFLCGKILANKSMKPLKLKDHLK